MQVVNHNHGGLFERLKKLVKFEAQSCCIDCLWSEPPCGPCHYTFLPTPMKLWPRDIVLAARHSKVWHRQHHTDLLYTYTIAFRFLLTSNSGIPRSKKKRRLVRICSLAKFRPNSSQGSVASTSAQGRDARRGSSHGISWVQGQGRSNYE